MQPCGETAMMTFLEKQIIQMIFRKTDNSNDLITMSLYVLSKVLFQ